MPRSTPLTQGLHLLPPGSTDAAAQALRARFLIDERGYIRNPAQLSDAFDRQAGYVLVKGPNGRCDALMRIIHSGPSGFELERYLDPGVYVPVTDRSIEVAELIIGRDQRASITTLQLALGFGGYIKNFSPDTVFSLSTRETASHYDRLGMTVCWDVKVRALIWNTDVWFCYARPGQVILDKLVENAPRIYRRSVMEYLDNAVA